MQEVSYEDEPEHEDLVTTVSNLASVRKAQGRLSEAAEGYERALRMEEKVYAATQPNHPELATTISSLAGVREAQGRLQEAEEGYERALRIREIVFADELDHPSLTMTAQKLAGVREARSAVRVTDTLDGWLWPECTRYSGLVVKRPFNGRFNEFQGHVDDASIWIKESMTIVHDGRQDLSSMLAERVDALLTKAALPTSFAEQIRSDACSMGKTVMSLCPAARTIEVKLETFGRNSCARWHQDHYVVRTIVSYTGAIGTEYTADPNVNFGELRNCGHNSCVIRDASQVFAVDVGDFLCIKGIKYPEGASGLVHKAPETRYHPDGRVIQRLCLKVDVSELAEDDGDDASTGPLLCFPVDESESTTGRTSRRRSGTAVEVCGCPP